MQSLAVTPAHVHSLSGDIRSKSNAIKTSLADLDSKVSALRASWSGETQSAYTEAQTAWNRQITEMEQLLSNISVKLEEIADGYAQRDIKGAGRFRA